MVNALPLECVMIPEPTDPRWKRVLQSDADLPKATLATRILVSRLRREVRVTPALMSSKIIELRAYYQGKPFATDDFASF